MPELMVVALEGEGAIVVTENMDKVLAKIPDLFSLAETCFTQILENDILTTFFSVSMIGIGLGIFKKLKRTARA